MVGPLVGILISYIMYRRRKGGLWIFSLFVTNEIPSVVVTFVAVVMFLQMGVSMVMATVYSAMLLLPWALQPLMRHLLLRIGDCNVGRRWIWGTECLTAIVLVLFAMLMGGTPLRTLGMLMCISCLASWHDIVARTYYGSMMRHMRGRWGDVVLTVSSQAATVLTYGLMIMAVGVLEIYFRQKAMWYSWAMCCYLLAGAYMMFMVANMVLMKESDTPLLPSVPYHRRRQWVMQSGILALLLLPQGLMFFSRTIFLLARPQQGGLGCTLQEVGFAQGTMGVIAFLLGVTVGRRMLYMWGAARTELPLTVCLGLSPLVYLIMTQWHPDGLPVLSGYTFLAQLLFGLGLNGCRRRIEYISGERYRNVVNPLYIPVISLCLLLPMACSGYLAERLSFKGLFLLDTLCAPVTWIAMAVVLLWRWRMMFMRRRGLATK